MKTKITSALIIILLILFSTLSMIALAENEISVFYNGNRILFDVNPMLIDGRTMVPMRAIFEAFGASVEYNAQTQQIFAKKADLQIILNIGKTNASVSKMGIVTECILDAVPTIMYGRTVVPLRFIGESLGASVIWNGQSRTITITPNISSSIETTPNGDKLTATDIAKFMAPRSVIISCYDSSKNVIATGSGFFIDTRGHIVTNYHVLEDAVGIQVTLTDGSTYETGHFLHIDRKRDLAVISIDKSETPFVTFGDSSLVVSGDTVYTYGSPKGMANMISDGIVSNSNVTVEESSYIFVTAPISPGSSGGCLIDDKGNVIGVTTISRLDSQNINGAIPVNDLKNLLNQSPLVYKTFETSNGSYEGYTLDGVMHFSGCYKWDDGDEYLGDWEMGIREGFGIYTWSNSVGYKEYYGNWTDNAMNGFGNMTWVNGDKYSGNWIMGMRTGYGRLTLGPGDYYGNMYEGEFLDGYFHGEGIYIFSNGNKMLCVWDQGKLISSTSLTSDTPLITTPVEPKLDLVFRNSLLSRISNVIVRADNLKQDYKNYLEDLNARGILNSSMGDQAYAAIESIETDLTSLNTLYDQILNATTNNELYQYETTLIAYETAYK